MSPYLWRSEAEKKFMADIFAVLRLGAEEGPQAVISLQERTLGRPASAEEKKRVLDNDYKALFAVTQNLSGWPATGDLLSTIAAPCLLYVGERDAYHDGVTEAAKHIRHASFFSVPGLAF
jgi:pimeloyl-ACP methyl ester carboxylesterase